MELEKKRRKFDRLPHPEKMKARLVAILVVLAKVLLVAEQVEAGVTEAPSLVPYALASPCALQDTLLIRVGAGWNSISVPILPLNSSITELFPGAISPAYVYDNGYWPVDSIPHGRAFWLKFASADSFQVVGGRPYEQVIPLLPGWNLISSDRIPVAVASLYFSPETLSISGFFGYSELSGYNLVDTLQPGLGYWVKVNKQASCTISEWRSLGLKGERVTALAVRPSLPSIIYAGSQFNFSAGTQGKFFKSSDGGISWDTLLYAGDYKQIEIDPQHPETVYALSGTLSKSTDGGITWTVPDSGITLDQDTFVWSVGIDPSGSDTLFLGTGGFFGGRFYKSTNGGMFWSDITTHNSLKDGVESIAFDPLNPQTIYAGTATSGSLLKSTDGGRSWALTGFAPNGQIIKDILVNPGLTTELVMATYDTAFYRSTDAGASWNPYDESLPTTIPPFPEPAETLVAGMRLAIDASENSVFGIVAQGQTGPPYSPGPSRGIYVRCSTDAVWKKIGMFTEKSFSRVDLAIDTAGGFLYFGGQGIHRLKYK